MEPQEMVNELGKRLSSQNFDKRMLKRAESSGDRQRAEQLRIQIRNREQEIKKLRGDLEIQRRKVSPFAVFRSKAISANYSVR